MFSIILKHFKDARWLQKSFGFTFAEAWKLAPAFTNTYVNLDMIRSMKFDFSVSENVPTNQGGYWDSPGIVVRSKFNKNGNLLVSKDNRLV